MRAGLGLYRRGLTGLLFLSAAAIAGSPASAQNLIEVTIDFAKVLRIDLRPEQQVGTVVIGNQGIADAVLNDKATLVLTGKAAGTTNLIVIDREGEEIVNSVVRVSSNVQQLTTVFSGSTRRTFSCAPTCEQVILVGDDPAVFKNATEQIQTRQQFAVGE
jgi:Flp pilus assembly secretin CpaC